MQTQHQQQREFGWTSGAAPGGIARSRHAVPRTSDASSSTHQIWHTIASLPGVRSWRILRDVAFLLTSLPLGLAAFIVAITGGTLGLSLSWLLIGIPILVWTIGLILRFAAHERERFSALLSLDLGEPRYPANAGENVIKHLWSVIRSPQVRSDVMYMMLLLPLGIIEFALVLLPLEFVVQPLLHLAFGSVISASVLGVAIDSRPEALLFIGLGVVLLMPMLILMNIATNLHASLARKMLTRR